MVDFRRKMTVEEYLAGPEDLTRMELLWGNVLREPSPGYGHQSIITRATVILELHVRTHGLGLVCVSPMDVILDKQKNLILQPDVLFVSNERVGIVRDRVWGPPDLVVEVISRRTAKYDRHVKSVWYREYGVKEFWLIEPDARDVAVLDYRDPTRPVSTVFTGDEEVVSFVLPELREKAAAFFK